MERSLTHRPGRPSLSLACRIASRCLLERLESRQLLSGAGDFPPPVVGPEALLPGDLEHALSVGQQTNPSLAEGPNGVSLAVWQDTRSGGHPAVYFGVGVGTMTDIYAARVRADGTLIDVTPIPVAINSYNQINPRAAWNGTNWLVAWSTERSEDRYETDIHALRMAPDGTVLDQQPMVIGTHLPNPYSSDDIDPYGPLGVVSNGSDWFVTWRRHNPNIGGGIGMEWFATRVTASGTVPDLEGTKILTADQYAEDFGLAFSPAGGGQFMHVFSWYSGTFQRRFDANMNMIPGSEKPAVGAEGEDFSIAGGPSGWLATWEGFFGAWPQVQAARIAPDGMLIDTTPLEISEPNYGVDFSVDGVWNGVNWTIAFSHYSGGGSFDHDLFSRRLEATGPASTALGSEILVIGGPGNQYRPQLITSDDGGYKMLYQDSASTTIGIAVGVISPADQLLARRDVSIAAPSQGQAQIASDGSNFLAVYPSSNGYGTRLVATRLSPSGVALDAEPIELADASVKVVSYEVVYLGGRYVATFNATAGPQGNMIYARTINSDGTLGPITALMPNAPFTGFSLGDASVLGDRMILVGNSNEGANHTSIRFARIFDSNLASVTGRINVNYGFALSGDTEPVGGRWLIAYNWQPTHDSPRPGVAYVFVTPDGIATSAVDITGTYPSNSVPTVVSNGGEAATEAMIVFPQSKNLIYPQINNEDAIRAQRIAADGTRLGGLITLIDQPQIQAQVRGVFDGTNYVLSWTDQRNYPYPAQGRDDIFAARVAPDGTVLDPGGFAVADDFRPEYSSALGVVGGQVLFMYRSFRHEVPFASYRLATRTLDGANLEPPVMLQPPRFDFETDQAISFRFNKPLTGVDASDLIVQNLTTGQTLPSSSFTVQTVPANTEPWTYRWVYDGILPDANFRATLPAGSVTDLAGNPTTIDYTLDFFFLSGDANRDARVNLEDFNILAANFGQLPRTFSQGDFNYDGVVNLNDFNILASRFGLMLQAPNALPFGGLGEDRIREDRLSEESLV